MCNFNEMLFASLMGTFVLLGVILIILLTFFLILSAVAYFVKAFKYYEILKDRENSNAWIAFVPVFNDLLMINLFDAEIEKRQKIKNVYMLLICSVIMCLATVLVDITYPFAFNTLLVVISAVIIEYLICSMQYELFKIYSSKKNLSLLFVILILLFPNIATICSFATVSKKHKEIATEIENVEAEIVEEAKEEEI